MAVLPTPAPPIRAGLFFVPADERLHHPRYLEVPADDGIQLAVSSELGQVDAVPLQGAVAALGPRVGHAVASPNPLKGLVDVLQVQFELSQNLGRVAFLLLDDGHEQVLGAYEIVVHPVGLSLGPLQDSGGPGSHVDLGGLVLSLWRGLQQLVQPAPDGRDGDAELLQDLDRHALLPLEERHQDVLHVPLTVPVAPEDVLRLGYDFLRLLCKLIWSQNHFPVTLMLG